MVHSCFLLHIPQLCYHKSPGKASISFLVWKLFAAGRPFFPFRGGAAGKDPPPEGNFLRRTHETAPDGAFYARAIPDFEAQGGRSHVYDKQRLPQHPQPGH